MVLGQEWHVSLVRRGWRAACGPTQASSEVVPPSGSCFASLCSGVLVQLLTRQPRALPYSYHSIHQSWFIVHRLRLSPPRVAFNGSNVAFKGE
jgi:hypothetical protein